MLSVTTRLTCRRQEWVGIEGCLIAAMSHWLGFTEGTGHPLSPHCRPASPLSVWPPAALNVCPLLGTREGQGSSQRFLSAVMASRVPSACANCPGQECPGLFPRESGCCECSCGGGHVYLRWGWTSRATTKGKSCTNPVDSGRALGKLPSRFEESLPAKWAPCPVGTEEWLLAGAES